MAASSQGRSDGLYGATSFHVAAWRDGDDVAINVSDVDLHIIDANDTSAPVTPLVREEKRQPAIFRHHDSAQFKTEKEHHIKQVLFVRLIKGKRVVRERRTGRA